MSGLNSIFGTMWNSVNRPYSRDFELKEVTAPAVEPLLVGGDAKLDVTAHLRLDAPDGLETAYLNNLIKAARRWAENATGRFFIEQTWDLLLPHGFPCSANYVLSSNEIRIPRAPLKASGGIVSVKYLDVNGTQQTLTAGTDYASAARGDVGVVLPAYGKFWPAVRVWIDASGNYPVEVRFIAGYGTDGTAVPEHFRQAMLLLIAHWYENREEVSEGRLATVPMAAEALLSQDRFSPW
jgi:uncharacterized phiE125 gp8 family phage protein